MAKHAGGRPTKFTPELLHSILLQIADGATERSIFRQQGYPAWQSWTEYKRKHPEFHAQYARAKEDFYSVWEDECIEIAEDQSRDVLTDAKGNEHSDNTAVNRDRLRIDSRKWLMSKAMPKKYGDKIEQEISGKDGAPLVAALNITIEQPK